MANRVLVSPDGLKISRPGRDVLTADARGLLFSSEYSTPPAYLTGATWVGRGDWVYNAELYYWSFSRTIYYGRGFANPPLVSGMFNNRDIFCNDVTFPYYFAGDVFIGPETGKVYMNFVADRGSMQLQGISYAALTTGDFAVEYVIMESNA